MKKIVLVLLLIGSIYASTAQDKISFSVFQDVKLLVSGDNHANKPGTTNLLFNMDWEGKQFKWYYFTIKTQYETANLSGGDFKRYSAHGGWVFNQLFIPKLEAGIYIGLGMIHRGNPIEIGTPSYSIMAETSYPIAKHFSITAKYEVVRRSDLVYWYNTKTPFKPNFSVGIKINNVFEIFN